MAGKGKIIAVGALAAGLFLFMGSASAGGRPPYVTPVPVPGIDVPWSTIDEALCLCWEAQEPMPTIARCVLLRVYPEVPWPSQANDHPSVRAAEKAVGARAVAFARSIARGERPCDPDVPPVIVDPPPPPPDNTKTIADYFADVPTPGRFNILDQGSNPTRLVTHAYDTGPNATAALRCMAGTGFNLYLYSRPVAATVYYSAKVGSKHYDVGPAWLPAHTNLLDAALQGWTVHRQVSWSGGKLHAGAYGSPWLPDVVCSGASPWDPARNPPANVLAAMGLELGAMQHAWEAANG